MAETTQIIFSYKEVAEALLKQQGVHEGVWGIYIKFGIKAANVGETSEDLRPTAIVPILEIERLEKEAVGYLAAEQECSCDGVHCGGELLEPHWDVQLSTLDLKMERAI